MSDQEQLLREAQSAIENDQKARARDLLARLIKLDPKRAEYWLYMSGVVLTRKEQVYCLKEAFRLDPKNELALLGLSLYGEAPAGIEPRVRMRLERREWQPAGSEAFQPPVHKPTFAWKNALWIGGILAALAIISVIFFSLAARKPKFEPISVLITAGPSPTYLPT